MIVHRITSVVAAGIFKSIKINFYKIHVELYVHV